MENSRRKRRGRAGEKGEEGKGLRSHYCPWLSRQLLAHASMKQPMYVYCLNSIIVDEKHICWSADQAELLL